jgi:hypothetical protein
VSARNCSKASERSYSTGNERRNSAPGKSCSGKNGRNCCAKSCYETNCSATGSGRRTNCCSVRSCYWGQSYCSKANATSYSKVSEKNCSGGCSVTNDSPRTTKKKNCTTKS